MKINLKFLAATMILSSSFFSCNVNVGDPTKVYVCSTCEHEYNTKEEAQNCKLNSDGNQNNRDNQNNNSDKIYICGVCEHEYDTKEEAKNCENTENCPGFTYKINFIWDDFETSWKIYHHAYNYYSPGYEASKIMKLDSSTIKCSGHWTNVEGWGVNCGKSVTFNNGEFQKRFIATFMSDTNYNDIDLQTLDWKNVLSLEEQKIKPYRRGVLPSFKISDIASGNSECPYLYAELRYFSDPQFKNQINDLTEIKEDKTIYVRLYGIVTNNKSYNNIDG